MTNTIRSLSTLLPAAVLATTLFFSLSVVNAQETILGLDFDNNVVGVQSDMLPLGAPTPVTGLAAGDTLVGIDFRSGTGEIYAIGINNNVYTLDRTSFAASLVGNFADGVNDDPANVGALSGNTFAFDFNPAFTPDATANDPGSFARIISDTTENRVINGNTGEYLGATKVPVFYAAGDDNEGATPNIQGIAYDNSFFGTTSTTQFGIDVEQDTLVTIANNAGTLATVANLTLEDGSAFDVTGDVGFDISGQTGVGYVSIVNATGASDLYTIDLTSGQATLQGAFGLTGSTIQSLTVVGPAAVPEPSSLSLLALGTVALIGRRRRK